MLLFRDEEHVNRWCQGHHLSRGAVLNLDQGWRLAHGWYHDRLDAGWRRKTREETIAFLEGLGLVDGFWNLGG